MQVLRKKLVVVGMEELMNLDFLGMEGFVMISAVQGMEELFDSILEQLETEKQKS